MSYDLQLRTRAKRLRKNQTAEKEKLWQWLRRKNVCGIKFRRQHIISGYIVDFYAPEVKLVIEIDGGNHRKTKEYDRLRDKVLRERGFGVLRFWNGEIRKDILKIAKIIKMEIKARLKTGEVELR